MTEQSEDRQLMPLTAEEWKTPSGRLLKAIYAGCMEIKQRKGDLNGGDVVDMLTEKLETVGLDVDRSHSRTDEEIETAPCRADGCVGNLETPASTFSNDTRVAFSDPDTRITFVGSNGERDVAYAVTIEDGWVVVRRDGVILGGIEIHHSPLPRELPQSHRNRSDRENTPHVLAWNILQRARLIADLGNADAIAALHLPVITELDYYLEDVATALTREDR